MAKTAYKDTLGWNLGFSSYWFATSYKWFILLFIILPEFAKHMSAEGEKNTTWGRVLGLGAIWALFGPALFGRRSEMARGLWATCRPWILLGSALTCVALAVLYSANNIWALGAGYLMLQVADDLGTGPYAGMVATTVPSERRGYASSVLGSLKLLGQIASAIVAMALKQPSLILVGIALVNIVCALVTVTTLKDLPVAPQPEQRGSFVQDYLAPFKHRDFFFVWLNRLVCAFATACIFAYTKNYLEDMFTSWKLFSIDLKSPTMAANVLALTISLSGVLGSVVSARISDRTGRKPLLVVASLAMAAFLVPIGLFPQFSLVWTFVFLFGIGNGLYAAADWALASDVLPSTGQAATQMGAWQSSETAVQIPAGIVMGWLIDTLNRSMGFGTGYQAMVWTAAVLFAASSFIVRGIRGAK